MKRGILVSAVATATMLIGASATLRAATNTFLGTGGTYDWTSTANWSLADYPGNTLRTDDDVSLPFNVGSRGTITLNQPMFPGGLAIRSIAGQLTNATSNYLALVEAAGTAQDPLVMNVGSSTSPPTRAIYIGNFQSLNLTNAALNIIGTPTSSGIYLEGGDRIALSGISTLDTTISMLASPVTGLQLGGSDRAGGRMDMTGGALTVTNTNATPDAAIVIGQNQGTRGSAKLTLNNTVLTTNNLRFLSNGELFFNNGSAAAPSTITNALDMRGIGTAHINSGTLNVGGVALWAASSGATINVTGGTLNVAGAIDTGSIGVSGATLRIGDGGVVTTSMVKAYGHTMASDAIRVILEDGGTLNVAGPIELGLRRDSYHSRASFQMSGGAYSATDLAVGYVFNGRNSSDGLYAQTGGTGTVSGTVTLYRGTQAYYYGTALGYNVGTREFRVADTGVLTLTGPGFAKVTTGDTPNWLLTAADWDVSGTLRFDPADGVLNQTLLAFGNDAGTGISMDNMLATNFGIGTLDLSGIDGDEKLTVVNAGNFGTNALYVNNLIGLDLTTNSPTLKYLDSDLNIYYNANLNPYLMGATYDLVAGGQLLGFWVPEPGSFALLALATLALAARRRQRSM